MVAPPPIELDSIGMADSLILMVLALVVFGPRRLPQIGRQIGKLMYEFRKASNDFKFQMEEELRLAEDADRRKKEEVQRQQAPALTAPALTIEARASIGVVETPDASPYPGEEQYPKAYPPESVPEPEPEHHYPRISPPTTGEQVSASRPFATPAVEPATEPVTEASIGAEPVAQADPINPPTEQVSQHG